MDAAALGAQEGARTGEEQSNAQSPTKVALQVEAVHKVYKDNVAALSGVDLAVREGEFVTLLGPSGSGKTTLLMIIAGFEQPTQGRILAGGTDITHLQPQKRTFGVVFQSYALFPHLSVSGNVSYPLAARRMPKKDRQPIVQEALELVGLKGLGDRRPSELSGGQQQRVALARALVYRPSILLLDEPLGALDRTLRERMQVELRRLHKRVGVTMVYVTHDQDEALTMSDRIVVLRDGAIEQVATPEEVYARPASEFVAGFVGTANVLAARVTNVLSGDLARCELAFGGRGDIPCAGNLTKGSEALVVVRPERVVVQGRQQATPPEIYIDGELTRMSFAGSSWRYEIDTEAGLIQAHEASPIDAQVGERVRVGWNSMDSWLVPRW